MASRQIFERFEVGTGEELKASVDTNGELTLELISYGLDMSINRTKMTLKPEGANLLTEALSSEYPRKFTEGK